MCAWVACDCLVCESRAYIVWQLTRAVCVINVCVNCVGMSVMDMCMYVRMYMLGQ